MATTQTFLAALDALEPLGLPAETLSRVLRALAPVLIEEPRSLPEATVSAPSERRRRRRTRRRAVKAKAKPGRPREPNGGALTARTRSEPQRTAASSAAKTKSGQQRLRDGVRTRAAAAFLRQELTDEFVAINDLEAKAAKAGISRVALGRAASQLGARVKRVNTGGTSRLCWRMPTAPADGA